MQRNENARDGVPKPLNSYREAIDRFPRRAALAREIRVPASTARAWHQRDSIPPEWFERIGRAAKILGVALTEKQLRTLFETRLRDKLRQDDE